MEIIYSHKEIQKSMKVAYYSNNWSKIVDFDDYIPPSITKGDELLIKFLSTALNPADYKILYTRIPFYRWFIFPNYGISKDFRGEVVLIGDMVSKFRIGDKVFGFSKMGTFQEYTMTKESYIHLIPDRVKFEMLFHCL